MIEGILHWALQLKSHLSHLLISNLMTLNQLQTQTISLSFIIFSAYLICFGLSREASRGYSLLAFLMCMVISYSPLYVILNNTQYYGLFAIIYIRLTYEIKPPTAKIAALLIGLFQITMVIDRIQNAGVETFIYTNYEVTICMLHSFVIGSFIKSDVIRIERLIKRVIGNCFDFVRYTSNYSYLW